MTDTKAEKLTAEEEKMIDAAWEKHKAAGPVAKVINNNQPGWTNIVETAPNVTLDIGTPLYSLAAVLELSQQVDDLRSVNADLRAVLSDYTALRSLAAELVEGLEALRLVAAEAWNAISRNVPGLAGEIIAAQTLISRARAQGIGEREKAGG